jgi:hypothetical protein
MRSTLRVLSLAVLSCGFAATAHAQVEIYASDESVPTESATGRDTGFQARGYFFGNRLEYRAGAFQGDRDARSHNPFRYVGRPRRTSSRSNCSCSTFNARFYA